MQQRNEPWVVVATFGAVWEADFAAETLREAGIPAVVDGGPNVAIFGPGYQGGTQFGVRGVICSAKLRKRLIPRLRTHRCSGRRMPPGRRVRAGGLCVFPAANSFAPRAGGT